MRISMTDRPVVERSAIDRLKEWGGDELPAKLIDIFLTHTPERMRQIREGVESKESRTSEAGAHSLKSSAGNVGASRLQRMAERAEAKAEAGDLEGVRDLLPGLEEAYDEARTELQRIREGLEA